MAERAELKVGDDIHLIDLPDLEEDVRHARVTPNTLLRYPAWTGDNWIPVAKVPALADALDFPAARFHSNLLARRTPWLTLGLVVALVAAGFLQLTIPFWLGDGWDRVVHLASVGWEPSILDQAIWGPWSSQFVHANLFHLLGNLAVIAYCAFRCERALGPAGLAVVIASSVAGGAGLVVAFSELPCIGSSIIGFGLWGAQFALGWRYNDWIPQNRRGNYGFGTVVLTIPMWIQSVTSPDVSLLGHLGGWVGGIVAALFVMAPTAAPRAKQAVAALRAVATAILVGMAPSIVLFVLGFFPQLSGQPGEVVAARDEALTLSVPWRIANNPARIAGLSGWAASPEVLSPLFATVVRVPHPGVPTPDELVASWTQRLGGTAASIPAVLEREGWAAIGIRGVDARGLEWEAQELLQARGWSTARVGWYSETAFTAARERQYAAIVSSAEWALPENLERQKIAHERWPDDPDLAYKYGYSLEEVGQVANAMAVYATLSARTDGWEYNACRARMRICAWQPETIGCDKQWRDEWLARTGPNESRIWLPAVRWLAQTGECDQAIERAQVLADQGDADEDELTEALSACLTSPVVPAEAAPG